MKNHNMALMAQLLEWEARHRGLMRVADSLFEIGAKMAENAEGRSEDVFVVADNMLTIARHDARKEKALRWDEAVAALEVELDRLGLKELRSPFGRDMDEEPSPPEPSEEWLYVINLDMKQLVNLQLRLSLLNNKEQL